jgi:hypothetical protein
MRTAAGVLAEIKAQDPHTEVTMHYIRKIIRANQVPVVCAGRKKLVDVDAVIELLKAGIPAEVVKPITGRIRPVAIK